VDADADCSGGEPGDVRDFRVVETLEVQRDEGAFEGFKAVQGQVQRFGCVVAVVGVGGGC
jgi:hypothetical protein